MYFDNYTSSFYYLYLKAGFYRENCYTCRYANLHRTGDITLGDFWGIEKVHPELLTDNGGIIEKNKGISCILIQTDNGSKLIEYFGDYLYCYESTIEKVTFKNKMLLCPSKYNEEREKVLSLYQKEGYKGVDKWFWRKYRVKLFIKKLWGSISPKNRTAIKKLLKQ